MKLGRRAWLAGAGAAMLWPRAGTGQAQGTTTALLDRAAALPPAQALVLIDGARSRTRTEALDLSTARAGLTIDVELARFGAPPRAALKDWVADRAGPDGLTADRDGTALYALLLRRSAGDIEPAAAERRLRAELAGLQRRADRLLGKVGLARGSIGERYAALWRDERHLYPDDDRGRANAVRDMNAVLGRLRPQAAALVGPVPPFPLDAAIRALTLAEIAAGRGGFRDVPAPGHPGSYVVDLKDIGRRPRWTLPSVVAHETMPGHFIQLPIEATHPPHPLRLDYAAAFVEGWAIYAESLVTWPDPLDALGQVHWLLFRTTRALADIGVHYRGWSQDEARARLVAWQGMPAYFAPWESELPRIVREPGARVGEALVWLTIAGTAKRLRQADRTGFHQRLVADGRCRTEAIGGSGAS